MEYIEGYNEIQKMYERKNVEIIGGEEFPVFLRDVEHTRTLREFTLLLGNYLRKEPLGEALFYPTELIFDLQTDRVQPAFFYISNERKNEIIKDWVYGVPDIVGEILTYEYRGEKFRLYAQKGIKEFWVIEPFLRYIRVLKLSADGLYRFHATADKKGKVTSAILPNFELDLEEFFTYMPEK